MKVVVENLTGSLFCIEVKNDGSLEDLKKEIEGQEKLPYDRLILILDTGKEPVVIEEEEKESLAHCGIEDGSHIYLFFTPIDDGDPYLFSNPDLHMG